MSLLAKIGRVLIGILFVVMGICAITSPGELFVALSWLWSIMFIASGILDIILFFTALKDMPGRGFVLFGAIVRILLGGLLLSGGAIFTTIVAMNVCQFWIIFSGVESIFFSFRLKNEGVGNWWLTLIAGILMLLLGFSAFASAIFSTTIIALSVGIGMIISGIVTFALAFEKKAE